MTAEERAEFNALGRRVFNTEFRIAQLFDMFREDGEVTLKEATERLKKSDELVSEHEYDRLREANPY